jgi:hypothetical protein
LYTRLTEASFWCRFRIESVNVLFNSTIRFVPCAFFVNKQFRTCANVLSNEFTVYNLLYPTHWRMISWYASHVARPIYCRSRSVSGTDNYLLGMTKRSISKFIEPSDQNFYSSSRSHNGVEFNDRIYRLHKCLSYRSTWIHSRF